MEMTEWFDLSVQKPWEHGVYSVEDAWGAFWYMKWNGFRFMQNMETVEAAAKQDNATIHTVFPMRWRGLSSNPSKPKSKGNPKNTMYVVMNCDGVIPRPLASFESADNAREYAENSKHFVRIKKIRFRTPERGNAT